MLQALTGCAPTYGLEGLNLPEEVVDSLETEEDLRKALGMVEDEETVIIEASEEVEPQAQAGTGGAGGTGAGVARSQYGGP